MNDDSVSEMFWDKVRAARRMTPEQRMRVGAELFDIWRKQVAGAVIAANPHATAQEIRRELERRLAIARRLESIN